MWRNKKNWPRKKNSTWSWSRSGILISRRKNWLEYAARYDAQNSIWLLYLLHIIRNESGRLISFIDKPPNNERQHSVVARHLHLGNGPISYKYTGVLANYQVKHITRFDEKSTWDGSAIDVKHGKYTGKCDSIHLFTEPRSDPFKSTKGM